ncbi:MAG TPA: GspE/PulE family protein [Terriglobales bacterium]|nr:GspE/PulE family protein [Terriglobales bacterium]
MVVKLGITDIPEQKPAAAEQKTPAAGANGGRPVTEVPSLETEKARDIARRYRCEFVDLRNFNLHHDLFTKIPVHLMFRYNFVPLEETPDGRLAIAIADPSQLMMIDEIGLLLDRRVITKVSTLAQITEILKKTEQSKRVLEEASEGFALNVIHEEEGGDETISIDRLAEGDSPIIRLVDTTIFTALQRRASDIHIESRDDSVMIKFRIDGVLTQAMPPIGREHHSTIISRIKVMSELDISERRVPQDGRFRVKYGSPERPIDFRVSIMPSIHGEDAVLRVLDKESMSEKFHQLSLEVVGFDEDDLRRFRRYIKEPYGMVLVTGPTGSGKTTTLYAGLSEIKTDEDKIITIEDPVEYQIRGITQIPVNEKKGLTFARGLRSILRHDPDKIMVGEIRDAETAQIAIQSALTGHLVFTTVHANNVVDVIGRFLNMGVEPYNFVSALNCILAQRLVRLICNTCRSVVHYPPDVLEASGLDPEQWAKVPFYEGQGCIECAGTGFRGRSAIHELLDLSDRIREMILTKRPTSEIRRAARDEGMRFLRESALDKVRLGMTTLKEINKVTFIENMR